MTSDWGLINFSHSSFGTASIVNMWLYSLTTASVECYSDTQWMYPFSFSINIFSLKSSNTFTLTFSTFPSADLTISYSQTTGPYFRQTGCSGVSPKKPFLCSLLKSSASMNTREERVQVCSPLLGSAGKRGALISLTFTSSKLTISKRTGSWTPKVLEAVTSSSLRAQFSRTLMEVMLSLPFLETPISAAKLFIMVGVKETLWTERISV